MQNQENEKKQNKTKKIDQIILNIKSVPVWWCLYKSSNTFWSSIYENVNDTHREKTLFHSFQHKNGCVVASDLFHVFTQSIKFYTFHHHILRVQMFEKCDSSIDSKN